MLNRVSRLVSHYPRELFTRTAFDIEHLTAFQPNETRMCEIERDREAGHALRREPLLGKPDVRAQAESTALERLVERIDSRLKPRPFHGKAEILDAKPKQSFGGPGGPGEAFRHIACEYVPGAGVGSSL